MHRTSVYRVVRQGKIVGRADSRVIEQLLELIGPPITQASIRRSLYELDSMGLVTLELVRHDTNTVHRGTSITSVEAKTNLPDTASILAMPFPRQVTTVHLLLLIKADPSLYNEGLYDESVTERIKAILPELTTECAESFVQELRFRHLLSRR